MDPLELKYFLDIKSDLYNRPDFISNDPICIPHAYQTMQDREIAGFFAALLAWGQRKTIINKCRELLGRMDNEPYEFILYHSDADLKKLLGFKHRTFNDTDLLYFVAFLKHHYQRSTSLEQAFVPMDQPAVFSVEASLIHFRSYFFSLPNFPSRTKKHISSPLQKSTCKRLNMFLRWMVRKDDHGVDFGIWKQFKPSDLICPCDVHVDRVARKLGLIRRKQTDWVTAIELSRALSVLDPKDPVKYDFALFGLGIEENF